MTYNVTQSPHHDGLILEFTSAQARSPILGRHCLVYSFTFATNYLDSLADDSDSDMFKMLPWHVDEDTASAAP